MLIPKYPDTSFLIFSYDEKYTKIFIWVLNLLIHKKFFFLTLAI
ncbi:Uncharacterized protein dnm_054700 [Desulfonema magnum]|uniref:Uncharacterized protein n=1 Tax=Desulfonema magnum TaxID=45655 RepID=A0A975BQ51_9BACT|nr:Uncharacterized protein dnm_054700 [Desulfonema magnum]